MPQLIAMIIVVVGAMIYMFQTFGGTGDKVEGIAQKTSIITEVNNIKNGLQLASRGGEIVVGTNLETLAKTGYFAEQINKQIVDSTADTSGTYNIYKAISFGGTPTATAGDMELSLVTPAAASATARPGIFVDLSKSGLKSNVAFLESQIVTDLSAIASIDRKSTDTTAVALTVDGDVPLANRASSQGGTATTDLDDGKFTIYFKDIPAGIN